MTWYLLGRYIDFFVNINVGYFGAKFSKKICNSEYYATSFYNLANSGKWCRYI